jgi:hypothetical protein
MTIDNSQLFDSDLPSINNIHFIGLEKSYLRIMYLSRLIFLLVLIVLFFALYFFVPVEISNTYFIIAGLIIAFIILTSLLLTKKAFEIKSYGIRKRDIIYKSGLVFRKIVIVPFNRVQHVELKSGPLDRYFGLSSLKIYTAGGSQSDLDIPGLALEKAQQMKEMIIKMTSADEEE